jgi:hypothetical protein
MADRPVPGDVLGDPLLLALREARPGLPGENRTTASPAAERMLRGILSQPGGPPGRPGGLTGRTGRAPRPRPQARRGWRSRRLVLTALVVVALVGAGLLGAGEFGPRPATGGGATSRGASLLGKIETASYVISRVTASVTRVGQDVIRTQVIAGGYTRDTWLGPGHKVRLRTYLRGRLLSDVTETPAQITVIDYASRTWWTAPNPPAAAECRPPLCVVMKFSPDDPRPVLLAAAFGRALTTIGFYRVGGPTWIGGRRALLLTNRSLAGWTVRLWVDAASYLPLRSVVSSDGQPARSLRSSIAYLPATAANVASLNAAVPAGFTQRRPSP